MCCDMFFGDWQTNGVAVPQRRSLTRGRLVFVEHMEQECPSCLRKELPGVRMPMCPVHFVCVECFRCTWFREESSDEEGESGAENSLLTCPVCHRGADL